MNSDSSEVKKQFWIYPGLQKSARPEKHPKTVAKIEKYRIAFVFQHKSVWGFDIVL